MAKPKRHHFVPRAYLARFGRDDRVAVRWRDQPSVVVASTLNVAVESGFYETDASDGSRSVVVEERLADVDGEASRAIADVITSGLPPKSGSVLRETLAYCIAIQKSRTPEARGLAAFANDVVKFADGRLVDEALVADYLERIHLGFRPNEGEIMGALTHVRTMTELGTPATRNDIVTVPLISVDQVASVLLARHWTLEIARKPRFITSDTPVTIWSKPAHTDRYRGKGVLDADEIRFPIGVGHQLVIYPRERPEVQRVEPKRVSRCNNDQAAGCHRYIIGHPDRVRMLKEISLATKRPTVRFNLAPLYTENSDGELVLTGKDVMHTWIQRFAPAPGSGSGRRR